MLPYSQSKWNHNKVYQVKVIHVTGVMKIPTLERPSPALLYSRSNVLTTHEADNCAVDDQVMERFV